MFDFINEIVEKDNIDILRDKLRMLYIGNREADTLRLLHAIIVGNYPYAAKLKLVECLLDSAKEWNSNWFRYSNVVFELLNFATSYNHVRECVMKVLKTHMQSKSIVKDMIENNYILLLAIREGNFELGREFLGLDSASFEMLCKKIVDTINMRFALFIKANAVHCKHQIPNSINQLASKAYHYLYSVEHVKAEAERQKLIAAREEEEVRRFYYPDEPLLGKLRRQLCTYRDNARKEDPVHAESLSQLTVECGYLTVESCQKILKAYINYYLIAGNPALFEDILAPVLQDELLDQEQTVELLNTLRSTAEESAPHNDIYGLIAQYLNTELETRLQAMDAASNRASSSQPSSSAHQQGLFPLAYAPEEQSDPKGKKPALGSRYIS